ncbi:DNA repair exonuclease [Salipaludibacillus agaradhaerens]|uniref:metallophosphoesterase family protein n=1 Tax=Salipaludibacillus agaradhaerens TaxID=76935 RepID=UPI002150B9FC|nr:DNA repair exonuclease [Salipaludibacillus agaradhaerens]MCR6106146.1 DNA repair exonuclease [Salipaludibacillus agaradhaerens]MCR6118179.1 DNA repair exonuclease [Salipaludibacillus agaradhaerens]
MIRFIHCADLHLGRPFQMTKLMNRAMVNRAIRATYESFSAIVQEAIRKKVDFVLVSGDVYHEEDRSIHAQWFFKQQAEKLHQANITLYVIHGNHDPLIQKEQLIAMPENVHIFPTHVSHTVHTAQSGERAIIYGFSYPERAFMNDPVPLFKKLEEDEAYHIGLLHGQENGLVDHDPYAPFSTVDLKNVGFDYWALGHVHKRQVINSHPPVIYPGNIQGCHRKEQGEKGAYYVEMTKTTTTFTFFGTGPVQWQDITVKVNDMKSIDELMAYTLDTITHLSSSHMYMIHLYITGHGVLHETLIKKKVQEDLMDMLQEELEYDSIWVDKLTVNTAPEIIREKWRHKDHIIGDVIRVREDLSHNDSWKESLSSLINHRKITPFVEQLTEEDEEEILTKAETMIVTALLEEGKTYED